jgi:hypothetical protein
MRKAIVPLALVVVFLFCSCAAGPHQLSRTVDDWDQQMYVENPLLNGVLWVVPVFPLAQFGAGLVDFFAVDAYHFWIVDLWDGKGTGFKHFQVPHTDGYMESLLSDGAEFFKVKK